MSKKRAHREMQKQEEELLPGHLFKPITPQDREKITNEIKATILEQRKKEEVNKKEEEEEESDDDELSEITGRMTRLGSSRKKRKKQKKRKPKTNRKKHTKKRKIKKRKSTRKK